MLVFQYNSLSSLVPAFGGCIKSLSINKTTDFRFVKLQEESEVTHNVNLDGCPANPVENLTVPICQSTGVTKVYNGTSLSYEDSGLHAFTEFIYRVAMHNPKGSAVSSWAHGRTKEGRK